MTDDIVLVTADSVRRDFVDAMSFLDGHDVLTGVTAGHYTRPSLAALQSSRVRAAVESKVIGPTLAEVLGEAGYTTIGLVPSAQADPTFDFDAGFEYYDNFMSGAGNPAKNRRSRFREYLGSFDLVRQVYRRVYPMAANMDDLPDDEEVLETAIEQFNDADGPRFLWVHLMGTHRPYGSGDDAIPNALDRTAEAAGGRHWFGSNEVSDAGHERIVSAYRDALGRADERIEQLLDALDSDPIFAFAADHGEELGEEGYYYHQGYRRRVADSLIQVPVVLDGIETLGERLSLLDIAPTLVAGVGLETPNAWQGTDLTSGRTEQTLTVAPWHEQATVCWQDFERKLIARDAEVSFQRGEETAAVSSSDVSAAVEQQLKDLGYADAG
ncbi:sulfatase-like hydrolase/transferase [Halorhabdus sp. CUG00001]|uniref:sulfatase-like hydrolase/transferase n=1 Tax=Halorhabdus sp. CUG00001 TaxID=2600297 RepID=UPI00131A8A35|nr:sulfatase-like hydrolase/transferase [Halorhabdus sp. CUG00001]